MISKNRLFDSPIIDRLLDAVRQGPYKYQSRVDVAKYTLSTYSNLSFSKTYFRLSADTKSQEKILGDFIKNNFDNVNDIGSRTKNIKEILTLGNKLSTEDPWIFLCNNDDHPFVSSELSHLYESINLANEYVEKYEGLVSIFYSHFQELNALEKMRSGTELFNSVKVIGENKYARALLVKYGYLPAAQIVHRNLFNRWYSVTTDLDNNVIRSESLHRAIKNAPQIVIVPKNEICRHYDGYMHTMYSLLPRTMIRPEFVPPLFIPHGYFESNIKIQCGGSAVGVGGDIVTIDPYAKKYSFEAPDGVDLKCFVGELPFAWKDKIVNINVDDFIAKSNKMLLINKKRNIYPWTILDDILFIPAKVMSIPFSLLYALIRRYSENSFGFRCKKIIQTIQKKMK